MVQVLFFSLLRDITGCEELDFAISGDEITVQQLLEQLYERYEKLAEWDKKLLIAVNCDYASRSTIIKKGDEIAIMPPVQGG